MSYLSRRLVRRAAPFLGALSLLLVMACGHNGPLLLPYEVEAAAKSRKPLVLDFYADWCKPCRHFEEKILPDPRVQAALQDVVFIRYDIETPAGRDAYRRCRGRGIPLVAGIDAKGVMRLRKYGTELTADEFVSFLAQVKDVLGPQFADDRVDR